MALIQTDFFSEALGLCVSMNVILPQTTTRQIGMTGAAPAEKLPPVLYLLHGLSDDHTIWLRRTSIERYVAPLGLAVVMPAVARSFYRNMACGPAYWDFVSEELPALVQQFFRVSSRREDTFVAGLSMGGYGAFKLALRCPEKFAAAASLSGAVDFAGWVRRASADDSGFSKTELTGIVGPDLRCVPEEDDLFAIAKQKCAQPDKGASLPRLFTSCGREDFLFADNERFAAHAREIGLPLEVRTQPGMHEWGYWDREIQEFLNWLPLRGKAGA
jgi:S-formylglutathione hydrolase FrmB